MIENDLSRIASALELIAAALTNKAANATPAAVTAPVVAAPVVAAPVAVMQAPVPVATPVTAAPVIPNVMPAAPVFSTPAPAPIQPVTAAPVVPATVTAFPSKQDMMDFVISSYKALGPEKGAKIQGVLEAMGYKNINDVPEAQWGQLKAGIEGLK